MKKNKPILETKYGKTYLGDSLELIPKIQDNSIDLVVTSPPFALLREKEYGNKSQEEYVEWLAKFAAALKPKLKESGSFVIDLGGAYKRGRPVRSLYNYRVLLKFCDELGYNLAEEFFWYNPAKLPSPIEWVNKRKIRVKDAVNTVWWFSKGSFPKADVRNVLQPYSERMQKLIKNASQFYTPKERPSGHDISDGFGKDNGGAMPSNLLQISNSESTSSYLRYSKQLGIKSHPARFPYKLPEFFIKMLTDEGDVVLDIFSGSNTTGWVAENLFRKWISFEVSLEYIASSSLRFSDNVDEAKTYYKNIMNKKNVLITKKRSKVKKPQN